MKLISIREARLADVPALLSLERKFDRDERQPALKRNPAIRPYLRASNAKFSTERMRKWLRSRNARVVIAQHNSVPCGFSMGVH